MENIARKDAKEQEQILSKWKLIIKIKDIKINLDIEAKMKERAVLRLFSKYNIF